MMRIHRVRGPVLAAALLLTAVTASGAASAALTEPPDPPPAQQLREEIDAMVAAGVPEDDPKVEMLEAVADDLADADPTPPRDPGAAGVADKIAAAEAVDAAGDRAATPAAPAEGARPGAPAAAPAWQSGPVLCEVVPGQLGPDEVAGAVCASVPQPDGTARYVAVAPDGIVRTVLFAGDGQVHRLADVPAGTAVTAGWALGVTPEGHLTIAPPGLRARTVDLP